jgi:hypothetical protein
MRGGEKTRDYMKEKVVNYVFGDLFVKVLLLITNRRSVYDVGVKKYVSVGEQLFCFCLSVICALLLLMNYADVMLTCWV